MSKQQFNQEPYYDDFSENKNFFRILFTPKAAIQTRELNQIQSILSHQTETFANHIFKFGSAVKAGTIRHKNFQNYVRLKDLDSDGGVTDYTKLVDRRVRGTTSGLTANVFHVEDQDEFDPVTLYVNYTNTAIDGETTRFLNGETLEVLDDLGYVIYSVIVRCPDCTGAEQDADAIDPTGLGSLFAVDDSIYYVHGYFVPTQFQIIALNKYDVVPTYKIGFDIVQEVVDESDDVSLYDNALGTPNFSAPGAHRYKISLALVKKDINDEDDENFILVAKSVDGVLTEVKDKTQYADIMDMMARRTYDESGDYTVRPFKIKFREHLKSSDTDTNGLFTAENGGDPDKFAIAVSPGKAYVRGREVEKVAESYVEVDKARDTKQKRSSVIRQTYGNYVIANITAGSSLLPRDINASNKYVSDYGTVTLYDDFINAGSPAGSNIGTARVRGMELYSGLADDPAAEWKIYLFDVQMNTNKTFGQARAIYRSDTQVFAADLVQDDTNLGNVDGNYKIYNPVNNHLLFPIPYDYVKSIRDADNPLASNTSVSLVRKFVGVVDGSGNVNFALAGNESFLGFNSTTWMGGLQNGTNYEPFDLVGNITSSPTNVTVSAGVGNSGKNFLLVAEVIITNATEKTKTLNTEYLTNLPGDVTTVNLMKPDAYRLLRVYDTTNSIDVTNKFELVVNIKDNYYDLSYLQLKAGEDELAPGTMIDVDFEYFQHSTSGYFFSVDSYTPIINDENLDFDYEDIPTYTTKDGNEYRMSDVIDFRPTIGENGTFDGTGAIITNIPTNQSNIIFDIEWYVPRIDLLVVEEFGQIYTVKGIPQIDPYPPAIPDRTMLIYQINIDAYTLDVKRNVRSKFFDNKRYTMRDIGKLEKRLENLEYYVSFNLLEKDTADREILDANGNSRFKNGFLTDRFKDFVACDTKNPEFSVAVDVEAGELRPSFQSKAIQLELDEAASENYRISSDIITLPYSDVTFNDQPFATKHVSVNPYFIFNKEGLVRLDPDSDVWKDTTTEPDLVVDIDTGFEALRDVASRAGILGTTWNSWQTTNQSITSSTVPVTRQLGGVTFGPAPPIRTAFATTRTVTNTQTRSGINRNVEANVSRNSLGTNVTSVNIIPYIRSIDIKFAGTGFLPRTKLHAFFDGVNVDEETRPINGAFTDDIVSDSDGNVTGVFTIPNKEGKRFFTGSRVFRLTNTVDDSRDADLLTTSGEAQFFSGGLAETKRETVLSVTSPRFVEVPITESRTTVSSVTRMPPPPCWCCFCRSGDDPLAQSFLVSDETGVFVTKLDLYFSNKPSEGETTPVWVQIRNMDNGYPGTIVLPYADVSKHPSKVNVSDDGTVPTTFEFEAPVYLEPDKEYCFVVGSSDKAYRCFVSRLGSTTLGENPVVISSQPHMGSFFKSQNDRTWTAEQYEDMKFTLYRADFDTSNQMHVSFKNTEFDQKIPLQEDPFETESGSRFVRVYHPNHNLSASDKVKIEVKSEEWFTIHVTTGNIVTGQRLVGPTNGGVTAQAYIKAIEYVGIDGGSGARIYRIKVEKLRGFWNSGDSFSGEIHYESFPRGRILEALDIEVGNIVHQVATGTVETDMAESFNGIPIEDFSGPVHVVQSVDSFDSYVIQLDTPATATGFTGGLGVYATGNIVADVFNLQVKTIEFGGAGAWDIDGIQHVGIGASGTNYTPLENISFNPNENVQLVLPMKIANELNEDAFLGSGNKSINIDGYFSSNDTRLTPVLKYTELALTAISNRIDWNDCDNYSIEPNAGSWTTSCTEPSSTARWTQETEATGGSEIAKYITKAVNLDNPATNIKIYMDVLDFLDTEVQVWYRTVPTDVESDIVSREWVYVPFDNEIVSQHDNDFREVEVSIPDVVDTPLDEFRSFQIKLVLRSKNSCRPPKIKNFRAIAVT